MKSNRFYLACYRDNVGSKVSFHRRNGSGYSTNIAEAETMTLEEAQRWFERCREFEEPLCADRVDALAEFCVDHQYIPCVTTRGRDGALYAGFQKNRFDGNLVFWISNDGLPTINFDRASFTHTPDLSSMAIVWMPALMAAQAAEKRISASLINRRSMQTAAGLITPDRVKKARRNSARPSSRKTRWNCPYCGRISWQYNPYDFDGCSNIDCSERRQTYKR
jgi:hypothetical protein